MASPRAAAATVPDARGPMGPHWRNRGQSPPTWAVSARPGSSHSWLPETSKNPNFSFLLNPRGCARLPQPLQPVGVGRVPLDSELMSIWKSPPPAITTPISVAPSRLTARARSRRIGASPVSLHIDLTPKPRRRSCSYAGAFYRQLVVPARERPRVGIGRTTPSAAIPCVAATPRQCGAGGKQQNRTRLGDGVEQDRIIDAPGVHGQARDLAPVVDVHRIDQGVVERLGQQIVQVGDRARLPTGRRGVRPSRRPTSRRSARDR